MTYTREMLERMSEFEVNKALAQKLGFTVEQHSIVNVGLQWCIVDEDGSLCRIKKYCSNWNDIMPLAVEYGINVNPNAGSAYAVLQPKNKFRFCDDGIPNAQRAIACCLLMMEIGK